MSTPAAAHRFIRRPEELDEVASALERAPWVAIDSESNSMFVYREQVCLLQVNAGGALFVVDPLALGVTAATTPSEVLAALRPALSKSNRPLWIHGGEYDAAVLRRDFAFNLGGLFDTQQAASLLGWQKTGYGSLAQEICGVTLSKQYATYDWATRPLLPDALTYAVDDVVHLPVIAETLRAAVQKAGIEDEVAVANAVVASSVWTTHFDPERMWRIKEIEALDENGLRALSKLYTWRNEAALAENLPPGRMVNDEVLKWLARHRPKSLDELRQAKLKSAVVGRHGASLVAAIASAQNEPVPTKPVTVRPPAAVVAREERLKAWRRQEAERRTAAEGRPIPLQLVLPSRALEHLKVHGAADLTAVPQLGARRTALYGEALQNRPHMSAAGRGQSALIITRSDDNPGVDVVVRLLRGRGVRPIRLDSDRYPLAVRLSTRFTGNDSARTWRLQPDNDAATDDVIDGNDVGAVWYRRFLAGGQLPEALGDLRQPAVDESRRTLYGLIAALDVPQMDRLEDVRRCDHKELQLSRARALGLTIADTLFSNDPLEVRGFVDGLRAAGKHVVTKMQSSFAVYRDGQEQVVFTSVVDDAALSDLDGLRFCPMQFQELVDKRIELRATVVGDDVFCAAVDSQGHSEETRIDWRKDGVGLLSKWTKHTLPRETERQLVALVKSFGLSYAAADFIVARDGRLVFLEINAGGEWFWLDEHFEGSPGLPIAAAIASWLQR